MISGLEEHKEVKPSIKRRSDPGGNMSLPIKFGCNQDSEISNVISDMLDGFLLSV